MKEGAWINARTGKSEWIDEHALYALRGGPMIDSLGLPRRVWEDIQQYTPDFSGPGRESILITVMNAGFIRMRGHGQSWSFEFTINTRDALMAIQEFLDKYAGPYTHLVINNLRTKEQISMNYNEFTLYMVENEPEKILRYATKVAMHFQSDLLQ